MSKKVGNISFYDSSGQSDFGFTKPYSEKTAELIDREVKLIIEESYERAKDVLKANMKGLTELAELLLEKEVIFSEDLERIFGKRKGEKAKKETDDQKASEKKTEPSSIENNSSQQQQKVRSKSKRRIPASQKSIENSDSIKSQ
jgi:cell division protease FtsH